MLKFLPLVLFCAMFVQAQDRVVRPLPRLLGNERRVALVVGIAAYKQAPLLNPTNDASAMAKVLKEMGFSVIYKENVDQRDFKRSVRAFGDSIKQGGVGLFFFAGHGVQVKGENYLIPTEAEIANEEEIEYEGMNLGYVVAQMEAAHNVMNVVILDACRDNPFPKSSRSLSRGLATVNAPKGMLIAYSTSPGGTAKDGDAANGLYTEQLLKYLREPNTKIEDMFKRVRLGVQDASGGAQVPWESSSLTTDFYFRGLANSSEADTSFRGGKNGSTEVITQYRSGLLGELDYRLMISEKIVGGYEDKSVVMVKSIVPDLFFESNRTILKVEGITGGDYVVWLPSGSHILKVRANGYVRLELPAFKYEKKRVYDLNIKPKSN